MSTEPKYRKRIKEIWDDYLQKVVPPEAGPAQLQETRRAFYAGAKGLFLTIMYFLDPGHEATENDMQKMRDLERELEDFLTDIKEGRA